MISKSKIHLQITKIVGDHFIQLRDGKRQEFFDTLRYFWGNKVDAWERAISNLENISQSANLLCLCSHVDELWNVGYFGLKPLGSSDDGKKVRVQFHWLPENRFVTNKSLGDVTLRPERAGFSPRSCKLWNCDTEKKFASGDVLEFRTRDPLRLPLPSFELLELRWHFSRILSMSGTSNVIAADLGFHRSTLVGVDEFKAHEEKG